MAKKTKPFEIDFDSYICEGEPDKKEKEAVKNSAEVQEVDKQLAEYGY